MSFFSNIRLISDYLQIPASDSISFTPTYHQVAQAFGKWPVVINEDGYKIKLFEWGVIADYMNTPEKIKEYRSSMANARSEKVLEDKRSVWHRIRHQRCLVFTTGFFEHRDIKAKKKLPYFIKVKDEKLFCFAGFYNYSPLPDAETGEVIGTFAIITRPANAMLTKIHNAGPNSHRMPLVLTNELAKKWLDANLDDNEMKKILDFEFPDSELEAWPVNTIRTRKEDNETVIAKIDTTLFPSL
ncbi:MAG TPA: SOS response-associated peptidase [Chitinophagaceae bacterium]|nr:SOS response-associated peptidase [Chitinophagaceae bacterium]